jgi:hypothetical protein
MKNETESNSETDAPVDSEDLSPVDPPPGLGYGELEAMARHYPAAAEHLQQLRRGRANKPPLSPIDIANLLAVRRPRSWLELFPVASVDEIVLLADAFLARGKEKSK